MAAPPPVMTEDEAKTKACCGPSKCGKWAGNDRLCIGSKCMAWRGVLLQKSLTTIIAVGFCGLTIKPDGYP